MENIIGIFIEILFLDIFQNLRAIGKVTRLGTTKHVYTAALLRDPIFKLSRWLGVFFLTDDLRVSYRVMVIGFVIIALMHLERFYRSIYLYPTSKNIKGITILTLGLYDINWFLALLRAGEGIGKSLKDFSTILGKLKVDYRTTWIFFTPFLFTAIFKTLIVLNDPERAFFEVLNVVLSAPIFLMPLQYAVLAKHCAKAFAALHQKLVESEDRQLERLAAIHCKLCQLSDNINNYYGPVILVTVSLFIALSMVFGYSITSEVGFSIIRTLSQLVGIFIVFLCTVYAASSVRKQADQFNSTLKNILISRGTSDDVEMENLKVYVRMRIEVTPSACGFFQLKPTLVISIFAGLISYTVILLSFSGKGKILMSL